jgi:hypothetical protein
MKQYRDGFWTYNENLDAFEYHKSGIYEPDETPEVSKSITTEECLHLVFLLEKEGMIVRSSNLPVKTEILNIIHRLLDMLEGEQND